MKRLIRAEDIQETQENMNKANSEDVDNVKDILEKISNIYKDISDNYSVLLQNLSILYNNYGDVYEPLNRVVKFPTKEDVEELIKNINDFNKNKQNYEDPSYLENYIEETIEEE